MAEVMSLYGQDLRAVRVPDLEPLHGCRVLVTGSTGLIGGCLVELLLLYAGEYGFQVVAGCRDVERARQRFSGCGVDARSLEYAVIDVTLPLAEAGQFDYMVDAASYGSPNFFASDPVGVMKANVLGVCHLLDYGVAHGLRRLVYVSSGEVYGEGCPGVWTESDSGFVDTMAVRSCYPSSKRAAESLCAAYASQFGVETCVARLCHTYGPRFAAHDNRVYAQFVRNVLRGEDIVMKSRGEQFRSWLYVVDAAAALLYLLVEGASGVAYNVANAESNVSIRELAELVAATAGRRVVMELPDDEAAGANGASPIKKAVFDVQRLNGLGWKPMFDLATGMSHTVAEEFLQ